MSMPSVGDRIKELRAEESLVKFSSRYGIHKSTLVRYEKGETSPDAEFIVALCRDYWLNPDWLLMDEGPKDKINYCSDGDLDVIASIDEETLRSVLKSIRESFDELVDEGLMIESPLDKLEDIADLVAFMYEDELSFESKKRPIKSKIKRFVGFSKWSKLK